MDKKTKKKLEDEVVSLCNKCGCMTKRVCGKCYVSVGDIEEMINRVTAKNGYVDTGSLYYALDRRTKALKAASLSAKNHTKGDNLDDVEVEDGATFGEIKQHIEDSSESSPYTKDEIWTYGKSKDTKGDK